MVVTVDFETHGIEDRPNYPPLPVGVSIKKAGEASRYYAWSHPTFNNCTFEEGKAALAEVWGQELLFHNAKFDLDVAETHMGLPFPHWTKYHDTMFLLYLADPHAKTYALKPSAARLLALPPDEQDRVKEWIYAHIPGGANKEWGRYICLAPGNLVGEYARGDTDRTHGLFTLLSNENMGTPYDRERRLMPVLLASERRGIRVDTPALQKAEVLYTGEQARVEREIYTTLGREFNIDSNDELADALDKAGLIKQWVLTPTGKRSMARGALEASLTHPATGALLAYRGVLATALGTFVRPWLACAARAGGRLHTHWHQTRGEFKYGTVTGRISSSGPNLTNVPNELKGAPPPGFVPPPLMRKFLLPDEGHIWLKRDYMAQEVRIMAHFEDGTMLEAFKANVLMDPHQFVSDLISQLAGTVLGRKKVKVIAFTILYGGGASVISERLFITKMEAEQLKELYYGALPGVRDLQRMIKRHGEAGLAVKTLGGRWLKSEGIVKGRNLAYKLMNHLIQGSASDVTKEAVVRYDEGKGSSFMLAQVYDEVNISAPKEDADKEMAVLKEAMESVECDVPLLTEGYQGHDWFSADKS